MVAIIATSSSSATSYVREHITNLKAAFYLQIFTVIGAIIGATINYAYCTGRSLDIILELRFAFKGANLFVLAYSTFQVLLQMSLHNPISPIDPRQAY